MSLEEFDFQKNQEMLYTYTVEVNSNFIYLNLPRDLTTFSAYTSVKTVISTPNLKNEEGYIQLIAISNSSKSPKSYIYPEKIKIHRNGKKLIKSKVKVEENITYICSKYNETIKEKGPITIEFLTPNCLYMKKQIEPFNLYVLDISINICSKVDKTIVYLDHNSNISLRCRKDNSEYHSLAYNLQDKSRKLRKITYFNTQKIKIEYTFGRANNLDFHRIIFPFYSVGIGLMIGFLIIFFILNNLTEYSTRIFILFLLPPFVELLRRERIIYTSADIRHADLSFSIKIMALIVYLPLLFFTILSLNPNYHFISLVMYLNLIFSLVFILSAICYNVLIENGFFKNYCCDICQKKIHWRKQAKLVLETRKTVCINCFNKINKHK